MVVARNNGSEKIKTPSVARCFFFYKKERKERKRKKGEERKEKKEKKKRKEEK